jgi:hypothetical protein
MILLTILSTQALAMKLTMIRQNGDVLVNSKILKTGSTIDIKGGDIITAKGKKSFAQIKLEYGEVVLIKGGKFVIKGEKESLKAKTVIQLLKGKMFIHVNKLRNKKNNRNFELQTKSAIMGVRGTKFFVTEDDEQSYLCVCEGLVSISNSNSKKLVKKGQDVFANKSSELKVSKANSIMWKVAVETFKEMNEYQ